MNAIYLNWQIIDHRALHILYTMYISDIYIRIFHADKYIVAYTT